VVQKEFVIRGYMHMSGRSAASQTRVAISLGAYSLHMVGHRVTFSSQRAGCYSFELQQGAAGYRRFVKHPKCVWTASIRNFPMSVNTDCMELRITCSCLIIIALTVSYQLRDNAKMVPQVAFVPGFHISLLACDVALSHCFESSTAIRCVQRW
jgi:hypothetical protein